MHKYTQHACEKQMSLEQRRRFRFVRDITLGFYDVNIKDGDNTLRFQTSSDAAEYFANHEFAGLSLFDVGETPWFLIEVATRRESQLISRLLTQMGFWFPIRLQTEHGFALMFRFNFHYGPARFIAMCEGALDGLADRFGSVRFGVHGLDNFLIVRDVLLVPSVIEANPHELLEEVANLKLDRSVA